MADPHADLLPLQVLLPETAADPVVVYDPSAALRFAVVERAGIGRLGAEWDQPGNYILLDPRDVDGFFGTYVGKAAPGGVRSRLMSHIKTKDHWTRAVVIQRDTTLGFNSAQVGWLEGRLYDLMYAAEFARLHNLNRPSDETLPLFDRNMLEQTILPIRRLLRLLGYDPAPADESAPSDERTPRQPSGKRYFGVALVDLVAAGVLTVGTRLVSTNGAWPADAVVVPGGIEFAGVVYPSPSAAAGAAKEGGAANGWDFWAIESETGKVPLSTVRAQHNATPIP
ncbi:hypothetical protein [Xylanimonas protaetiae]|uniref:RAMA domain-containing protein n=1 Tax=Xylanimonas protaetiae TaxID=2509457 RepID=A0A4P6F2L4_9MICO|nr:hypothetical protein [Xylanimonas protaetiae]QAY69744.1 hypothetical protein ET471_06560 [Xylanimonas protaetiae]